MATFDTELLKRFDYLWLVARQAGGRSLAAPPRKKLPGGGTEATGLRDYAPGDDYRLIDWTLCARRDELLSKTFEGDEDLHVYILLDSSPSMGLGRPPKFRLARRIAALLGYAAVTQLARVSVVAFSDGIVAEGPPVRHKARFPRVLRFLRHLQLQGTETDLARSAERFVRRRQRAGPTVVISDLYDRRGFQPALDILRCRGYEPRVVQIHEPGEAGPVLLGDLELVDVERGTGTAVTITEKAAQRYTRLFAQFRESVRGYCARHGITCMQVASNAPEDDVLLGVLGVNRARAEVQRVGLPTV